MSALEVLARLILIGSSADVDLGHFNTWISGTLGLLAMGGTAELAVRPYGKRAFDRLLLIAGSLVVTFILLGLVLNLTPWGMTVVSWNVSWVVLSILVLFWRRGSRTRFVVPMVPINVFSMSIVAAAAIFVMAAVLAINGVKKWNDSAVLSFSIVSSNSISITTEISATSLSGRYRIQAFSQARKMPRYVSKSFVLSAGRDGETIQERIPIKSSGRWVVDLDSADDGKVVRELIVNVD